LKLIAGAPIVLLVLPDLFVSLAYSCRHRVLTFLSLVNKSRQRNTS
jgi:hypothetical protein